MLTFNRNDIVKLFLDPPIGNLSDYLVHKFNSDLNLEKLSIIRPRFELYLSEIHKCYPVYKTIIDLQYSNDSLRKGPNLDNVSFGFDLAHTSCTSPTEHIFSTSLSNQSSSYLDRELIMTLNYRRIYLLGFKVDSVKKSLVIVDYVKQANTYPDDMKPVLFIPYGESLV